MECLAQDIPEHLAIDITNLGMGEVCTIRSAAPEGVTTLSDPPLHATIHAAARSEAGGSAGGEERRSQENPN